MPSGQPAGRRRYEEHPPPTKWTISSLSPSDRWVSCHCVRGTMLRFSSTATRSCFMPSCSTNSASVIGAESCSCPLMTIFIATIFAIHGRRSKHRPRGESRPRLSWSSTALPLRGRKNLCGASLRFAPVPTWPVMTPTPLLFSVGICGWRCGRSSWPAPGPRNPEETTRPLRSSSRCRRRGR